MKAFWKALAHAAIGGVAVGLSMVPGGGPITAKTVLLPVLTSAATSVLSLFSRPPGEEKPK